VDVASAGIQKLFEIQRGLLADILQA